MGTESEVLHGLPRVLGSTEEKCVRSSRRPKSELVQSQSLATGLLNPGSGSGGEAESSDRQLGHCQETVVIGNRANDDNGLSLVRLGDIRGDTRERDRGAVDSRHKQTTQHDFVEVRIRAACEETVELHENLQVDVLALRRLAMGAAHMVTVQVDTHGCWC